jgi:hypothetical protein
MQDIYFYLVLGIILYIVLINILDLKENYYYSTNNSHQWWSEGGNSGTKRMELDSGGKLTIGDPVVGVLSTGAGNYSKLVVNGNIEANGYALNAKYSVNIGTSENNVQLFSNGTHGLKVTDQDGNPGNISGKDLTLNGNLYMPNGLIIMNNTTCIRPDGTGSIYITPYTNGSCGGPGTKLPINRFENVSGDYIPK